jgi:hypothetical protein
MAQAFGTTIPPGSSERDIVSYLNGADSNFNHNGRGIRAFSSVANTNNVVIGPFYVRQCACITLSVTTSPICYFHRVICWRL